jgi:hypothetical protein
MFAGTPQQLRFIDEWAKGNSVRSAAARAGYKDGGDYGRDMTRNPHALAIYHEKKAQYEAAGNMNRDKFMTMLQESYDMAKLMSEPASMVAAAREVGKACGYYAPVERKISISGNVALDKMNKLSDQELLELLGQTESPAPIAHLANQIAEAVAQDDDDDDTPPLD